MVDNIEKHNVSYTYCNNSNNNDNYWYCWFGFNSRKSVLRRFKLCYHDNSYRNNAYGNSISALNEKSKVLIGKINRFLTVITIAVIAYSLFEALGTFLVTRDFAAYVFLFPYTAIRCASVFIWSLLFLLYFQKFKFKSGAMFIFLFGIDNSQYTILSGTFFSNALWTSINFVYLAMIPFGAFFLWKFSVKSNLISVASLAGYATIEGIYYALFYYNPILDFTGVLLVPIVFYNAIEPKYEDNIYSRLPNRKLKRIEPTTNTELESGKEK